MRKSVYFETLLQSASPQVKHEIQEMASKPSSFSSLQTILNEKFGFDGKTLSTPHQLNTP